LRNSETCENYSFCFVKQRNPLRETYLVKNHSHTSIESKKFILCLFEPMLKKLIQMLNTYKYYKIS
jgi:hypothetical protein